MYLPAALRSPVVADVALVVTWSSGFIGAELSTRAGADPLTLLGWRFLLLALLLAGACRALGMRWPRWSSWRRQLVVGVLCQPGYLLLVFEGVAHGVPGGTAALIAALQPLLVATVAGRLLGEPTSPRMWVGMALGLVGVVIVVSGDLSASGAPLWAYLLPTAGMLCLTIGTVLDRHLGPSDGVLQTLMIQAVITAVLLVGLAVMFGGATVPTAADFWWAVLWLIVLASLGGYAMYIHVARTQGATIVSTLMYLTPPTTMVWAFLMFGVPLTLVAVLGLAVSAVGVVLVLRGRQVREPVPVSGLSCDRRSAAQRLPRSG
jgi:drug/metabolite transporter (DMT)-like permease